MVIDSIRVSLFSHQINALCEEMGAQLQRAAFSPNIRDRLDYSCAMFTDTGELCAQAAHIPVHLGSMAYAMQSIVVMFEWQAGDIVIFNDPYLGGTHLPDVTLVMPVFHQNQLIGFVANRAHHADIGATEPGSMPLSSHIEQEGELISPQYLGRENKIEQVRFDSIFSRIQQRASMFADLSAQLGANLHGVIRLQEILRKEGQQSYTELIQQMFWHAESMALSKLKQLTPGEYTYTDYMDDDGMGNFNVPIKVNVVINDKNIQVDFRDTTKQVMGNINCPKAVTAAAVFYVFRCLMGDDVPNCAATYKCIEIVTESGSLVDSNFPAAVAAGNVETSSRIVDVVFAALSEACHAIVPASSQGTMNNIAMGSNAVDGAWSYYETIGGGAGANKHSRGMSAVQSHMTNTKNTPIEVLEMCYPLRITRYAIRSNSAGLGEFVGGDGIIREYEFLNKARVTILSDRREHGPPGLSGGNAGESGKNYLNDVLIAGKVALDVEANDRVRIETPGGGGFGSIESSLAN